MDRFTDLQAAMVRLMQRAQTERMDYCITTYGREYRVRPTGYARQFADLIVASLDGASLPQAPAQAFLDLCMAHRAEAHRLDRERADVIPNTARDHELSCSIHFHTRKADEFARQAQERRDQGSAA